VGQVGVRVIVQERSSRTILTILETREILQA
jgi:hypothetical protein